MVDGSVDGRVTPVMAVWNVYRAAYFARYEIEPVRNARVMGQLANFLKRIPRADAPAVVRHYLRSHNARYVQDGHSVGQLLQHAEKLRTEALTGRNSTASAARRADEQADKQERYSGLIDWAREEDRREAAEKGRLSNG